MGSSTAIRISSGLLSFAFLARMLGPESFGQLMLWFSLATLLGLIANYGLTPYMLREMNVQKENATKLIGDVLTAKLLIAIAMLFVVIPAFYFIDANFRWVFLLLFIATLFDSLTEFLNTGYRATNRYASETKMASYASVFQLFFVLVIVYFNTTVVSAALAIMSSRILVSLITLTDQKKHFINIKFGNLSSGFYQLKQSFVYAIDFFLQNLLGQVDSIVINHFVGPSAVGLYQSGMKVFQGGVQAGGVLGNVFLPKLAAESEGNKKNRILQNVQMTFVVVGISLGLFMVLGASKITHIIFGNQYEDLVLILPLLGYLLIVRFYIASIGVILTSMGMQRYRTQASLIFWGVVAIAAILLMPTYGTKGWIVSLLIGNVVLGSIYLYKAKGLFQPSMMALITTLIPLFMCMPFVL